MTVTVEVTTRPTHCTCRCGCRYVLLEDGASVAAGGVCFSCRVELHAGRRKGWKPTDRTPVEREPEPRHG